jgi:hypothetical protein
MIDERLAFAIVSMMGMAQKYGWQTRLTSAKSTEIVIVLTPQEWPALDPRLDRDLDKIEAAARRRLDREVDF